MHTLKALSQFKDITASPSYIMQIAQESISPTKGTDLGSFKLTSLSGVPAALDTRFLISLSCMVARFIFSTSSRSQGRLSKRKDLYGQSFGVSRPRIAQGNDLIPDYVMGAANNSSLN
jgi:hypothetical protein